MWYNLNTENMRFINILHLLEMKLCLLNIFNMSQRSTPNVKSAYVSDVETYITHYLINIFKMKTNKVNI